MSFNQLRVNISWNVVGGAGARLLIPLFQLAIARFLSPHDYGAFAFAMAAVMLFDVFKDLGVGDVLIANSAKTADFSILFSLLIITSSSTFALGLATLFVMNAYIDLNWKEVAVVLVTVASILLSPINDSLATYYRSRQDYKLLGVRQLCVALTGGLVGLGAVTLGAGAVSLALGYFVSALGSAILLWSQPARPQMKISLKGVKAYLPTGRHLMVQRVSGFSVSTADLIIVKFWLGLQSLGVYRLAHQLNNLFPMSSIFLVSQVMFTEFAKRFKNGDIQAIKVLYRNYAVLSGLVLLTFSVLVYLAADRFILLLLGEDWRDASVIFALLSCSLPTSYISAVNVELSKVFGFAKAYTMYGVIRGVGTLVAVWFAAGFGLVYIGFAWSFCSVLGNLVNEAIFHSKQEYITFSFSRTVIYLSAVFWFAFVVSQSLPAQI